jgi:hypothetical protein
MIVRMVGVQVPTKDLHELTSMLYTRCPTRAGSTCSFRGAVYAETIATPSIIKYNAHRSYKYNFNIALCDMARTPNRPGHFERREHLYAVFV